MSDTIEFPFYRSNGCGEYYRIDSKKRAISVRNEDIMGIGICDVFPEDTFAIMYTQGRESTKEEFDKHFYQVFWLLLHTIQI